MIQNIYPRFISNIKYSDKDSYLSVSLSNLNGQIWDGEIIIFQQIEINSEEKNIGKLILIKKYSIPNDGVTCTDWIGEKQEKQENLLSGGDEGIIYYWNLKVLIYIYLFINKKKKEKPLMSFKRHHNIISSIEYKNNSNLFISSSWDGW